MAKRWVIFKKKNTAHSNFIKPEIGLFESTKLMSHLVRARIIVHLQPKHQFVFCRQKDSHGKTNKTCFWTNSRESNFRRQHLFLKHLENFPSCDFLPPPVCSSKVSPFIQDIVIETNSIRCIGAATNLFLFKRYPKSFHLSTSESLKWFKSHNMPVKFSL